MKNFIRFTAVFSCLVFSVLASGCAASNKLTTAREANTRVLIYERPYDLVFLKVIEAADLLENWDVEITDKEKGSIGFHNVTFSAFSDEDDRNITVLVKRISRSETSVQLAPYSQKVIDSNKLLDVIDLSVKQ